MTRRRPLLHRRILFFGGKGGVGKTTAAAAFAILSARHGQRTLLVSTDPAHSTGDVLGVAITDRETPVTAGLTAIEIDPLAEADRYIAEVKDRIAHTIPPRLTREVERQIDIARISPGADEAALFDRFARILDDAESRYDRLIFDTAPTGHTLRLLSLPEAMAAWMSGLIAQRHKVNVWSRMWRNVAGGAAGPLRDTPDPVLEALEERRQRFERARRRLTDPVHTGFVFVMIPERLPILETARAVEALGRYGIPVAAVIVNRVLPADADGEFLARRREREAAYLDQIATKFADHVRIRLPLFPADVAGFAALDEVIAALPDAERDAPV